MLYKFLGKIQKIQTICLNRFGWENELWASLSRFCGRYDYGAERGIGQGHVHTWRTGKGEQIESRKDGHLRVAQFLLKWISKQRRVPIL